MISVDIEMCLVGSYVNIDAILNQAKLACTQIARSCSFNELKAQ